MFAALVTLNVAAVALTVLALKLLYERDIGLAETRSRSVALAIELALSNEISKIDLSLSTLISEVGHHPLNEEDGAVHAIRDQVRQHRLQLVETEPWSLADAEGRVIFSEGGDALPGISLADQDYFKAMKAGRLTGLVMTRPLRNSATGNEVVVFARAFKNSAGNFGGIAVIPLPLLYLYQLLATFDIGPDGVISLRDQEMGIITRFPSMHRGVPIAVGDTRMSPEATRLLQSGRMVGSYHARTAIDQVERIYGYRAISQGAFYTFVGVSKQAALAGWRNLAVGLSAFLVLFLTVTNVSGLLLHRYWKRQNAFSRSLQESNDRLAASLEELGLRDKALLAAQDAGGLGTYTLDIASGVWTSPAKLDELFGIDSAFPRTVDGWLALIHADDRAQMRSYFMHEVIAKRGVFDRQYRILRPSDGKVRWVRGLGKLEFDERGTPIRMSGTIQDITPLKESQRRLERMAFFDSLTSLPNRTLLSDRMRRAIAQCRRKEGQVLGVCYLDLDGFKAVNDQRGHAVGDQLLIEVAKRLQSCTRSIDTVARLGGDEFVVLFCGLEDGAAIENAVSRLLQTSSEPYHVGGMRALVTLSIGVTIFPFDAADEPDVLLRHADHAMYEAKRNGKNRMHFFDTESERRYRDHQQQYARLVEALANGEFRLFYQPKVSLETGKVVGAEALMRWLHPEQGLLAPGSFLHVIEATELTMPVGEWVLQEALAQRQRWHELGIDLEVSVNIFGLHLQRADFAERLQTILAAYPALDPAGLELEILETTALEDLDEVTERVLECKRLGVRFSLDDFGTGYSSLTYLRKLPVERVKIDRFFIHDMLGNAEAREVVHGIVGMAHGLGRDVVAEGVESLALGVPLVGCGCDIAQGYGIARPMPAEEIPAWLEKWTPPVLWQEATPEDVLYFGSSLLEAAH